MALERRSGTPLAAVLVVALAAGLSTPLGAAEAPAPTLYERLGRYDAIAAVVDDFLGRLAGDAQLGRFFQGVSQDSGKRIRQHLVDQVCQATGGPCFYTGRDMKTSHTGLGITESDWNAMVGHFLATLAKFGVPKKETDELVAIVATTKGAIVEQP
jgi:hemoglobin